MMNSDFTAKWDDISERGHGAGRFRVCPDHLLDLFISYSVAGEREFILESAEAEFNSEQIPAFENIDLHLGEVKGVQSLTLRLTDRGLTDLFSNICNDLAEASSKTETAEGAIQVFVVRLTRWAELLRRRSDHELSFRERLGLLGELNMLIWAIEKCYIDAPLAVRGWRGPDGDTNDIGLNNVRIEVKAQLSTQRQVLKISSLDQLDWDGRNLFIAINRFCPANEGLSLESLTSNISSKLSSNSHALMEFQRKLIVAGYDPSAGYVDETFKLEEVKFYQVGEGFPRLVPANVPLGISKVKYEILCETLGNFVISSSELEALIHG